MQMCNSIGNFHVVTIGLEQPEERSCNHPATVQARRSPGRRLAFVLLSFVQLALLCISAGSPGTESGHTEAVDLLSDPPHAMRRAQTEATTCAEEASGSFRDAYGFTCAGWVGHSCYSSPYYTTPQLIDVRQNCPICCNLASPSPPPPAVPPQPPLTPPPPAPPSPPSPPP
eukprot:437249-Prymnesium_polylepis.2